MFEHKITRNGQFKLYIQIYGIIKRLIEDGEWQSNFKIPSEEELSKLFGVSKTTIRLALSVLSQEGYLRRQQGRGAFVKSPIPNSGLTMMTRISDSLCKDNIKIERELLKSGIYQDDNDIQKLLNFEGQIFYIQCRNLKNNMPISIEELYVPHTYYQGITGVVVSNLCFLDLIKSHSVRKIYKINQAIQIVSLKEDIAKLLGNQTSNDRTLLVSKLFYDVQDNPIAYIRLYGNDKFVIENEFISLR